MEGVSDPSERDEPSFVTNVERSLDPRGPSPLGSTPDLSDDDDGSEPTEVGTVPGPRLHRLHDDADEPVENTEVLALPDAPGYLAQLPPMRPRLDSEAAGRWQAPGPNGAPLPISSDTASLHRSELVQPPPPFAATVPLGAMSPGPTIAPVFPSVPPPMYAQAPAVPSVAQPRRRRGSAIYVLWFLVVGVIGGAGIALKLGIVHRDKPAPIATVSAAPSPSPSPSPAVTAAPSATEAPSAAPSAAPTTEPSAAPAGSVRHGRPRRPRRGK